jgi:hypothetical protein
MQQIDVVKTSAQTTTSGTPARTPSTATTLAAAGHPEIAAFTAHIAFITLVSQSVNHAELM